MISVFFVVLQFFVYVSGFTKQTTIARGFLPAEGAANFVQDDDGITQMYSTTFVAVEYDYGITVNGWIYTGDPKPMITESKIQLYYYAAPWDIKLVFFGGNSTHLILREDFNAASQFAECAMPFTFNTFYHFTISLKYQYSPSKYYYNWFGLRSQDGTIATCSNTIIDPANILWYSGFHWAFQVRKPQDNYAFATQPIGGITVLGDYFFNSTDTDIMRFLLNFNPNSYELFTFQFSYEQSFCNCLIDSSTNKIQALSSLTNKQLVNYGGGGIYRFGFTQNEAMSFQSGKLRYGIQTDSYYRDLNTTRLTDFRPIQSVSLSFWMNIETTVTSFNIFTYATSSQTFTLSVALNAGDSMYYFKITDASTVVTLNSPINPSAYAHYIFGVSFGVVDLYTNGVFTLSQIGTFSTFFQAGITKSKMTLGGSILPVDSIVTMSLFRMFSSNAIMSSLATASSLIPNCQALIQNQQTYSCLYCKSGYFLKSLTDCVLTCGSQFTLLSNVKMCAPTCPYSCSTCDSVTPTKCLTCAGNRVLQASTGTCYCPAGTFEDYRSKTCMTNKKFTRGIEFGQFEMVKVNTITVQFANEFTTPPKVAFNVMSYSQGMLQTIPLFYITASSITTTEMVVNSNADPNYYFHIQYFAYNTSNPLYYTGALMFNFNSSVQSIYLPYDKGPYTSSSSSAYNIQVFLGGMECNATSVVSYVTCRYGWDYDQTNIHNYVSNYSKMVTRMYLYYILTPIDVTLVRAPLANNPYIFWEYTRSPFGLEKTSYFKPGLVIPGLDLRANHYEVLGMDMMWAIVYNDFQMLFFSYFKLLPQIMTFYDVNTIYCNADFSTKTDLLYGLYVEAMLYYEAWNSFALCQIVDHFTNQCIKCTNGKNPKIQCNNCATGQFFNSTAIECQCSPGYWQSPDDADTCIACDVSCATCTSADACDTCKGSLVQDVALVGYCHCTDLTKWFDSTGTCYYCNDVCLTCKNGTSCTSCYTGMTQIVGGLCTCPDHQWFYVVSHSCYDCYFLCDSCSAAKTSSSQNCLTCVAGRDLVGGSCVCTGSNDLRVFMDDLRCSKGTTAVLDAVLSNDFLTLNIDFGTAIQADPSLPSSPSAICGSLFDTSSILKIGANSNCAISGSSVIVSLGSLARILSGDTFVMNPNKLVFTYNSLHITDFGRQVVSQAGTVSSSISFDYPAAFNYCDKKQIKIASISNDGGRGIQSLTWSIVSMTPMDTVTYNFLQSAITDANTSQSQLVNLEMFTASSNLVLQIKMDWTLYIGQTGSKTTSLTVTRKRVFQSSYTLSQPSPYYRYKAMDVTLNFQTLTCLPDGTLVETTDLVNVQISNSVISLNEQHSNLSARSLIKSFPGYSFDSDYTYTFNVLFTLSSDVTQTSSSVFILNYQLTDLYAVITGGNRYINYKKLAVIESTLADYELDNSTNPPSGITPIWTCQDIGSGNPCYDQSGTLVSIPSTQTTNIAKSTFAPFTVVRIILTGTKDHTTPGGTTTRTKKSSVIAFFTEMDIPPLDVVLDSSISVDLTMNLNQIIHVQLNYDATTNPDNLFFAGAILYNSTVVQTMSFEYSYIRFKVWDYYSGFDPSDTAFQIRFSAYNPAYILPSITTLSFTLNFPPDSCTFTATPASTPFYALETVFTLLMDNCVDANTPINYQFFYYDSITTLDFETKNPLKVQRKQLNDRGTAKSISTFLPPGTIILIAQAIDNREAIANITLTKTLTTQVLNAADYLTFVNNYITSTQLLSAGQQIINLNLLTGDILSRGATLLSASDLQAKKIQIITLLETAVLSIVSSSYLSQLASQAISQILATPVTLTQSEQISKLSSLTSSLSTISGNCASSQVSQEKYQKCVENMYLTFNQIDGISQNAASGVSTIDSSFVSLTETIGDILTAYALPNEDPVEYGGSLINIKSQKITDKLMINYLGMSQTRLRLLATSGSTGSSIYDASYKIYTNNLYSNDASFKEYSASVANYTNNTQMTTVFPVINPSVKTSSNGSSLTLTSEAAHFFKNTEPKRNLTCFSKSKSSSKWTTSSCSTYLSNKTNEIQCFCPELSPTTVVEDISSLFTNNKNLATAFSSAGLANISNFTNFYLYIVFWVLLGQTIGLIILIIKGRALDAANIKLLESETIDDTVSKNSSSPAKVFPLQSTPGTANLIKEDFSPKRKPKKSDFAPLSSHSMRTNNAEPKSQLKIIQSSQAVISADKEIQLLSPSKSNFQENTENVKTLNLKKPGSKISFPNIPLQPCSLNEGIELEQHNSDSPHSERIHQSLSNDSNKNLKNNGTNQFLPTPDTKQTNNLDHSLTQVKSQAKLPDLTLQKQRSGLKRTITFKTLTKAKELEQNDKQKLQSVNKYLFFLYFHDFFSIFFVFLKDLSRPVRFVLFYLRYTHTLVISIMFSSMTKSLVQTMFVSLFSSVIITIVSKLVSTLLGKKGIIKKIGALFTFSVITFYLYLILSVQSGSPYYESNDFIWSYLTFFVMDVIIVQTLTALAFSLIAKKVIRQDSNKGGFFFRIFDFLKLNIIVTSLINFAK